MLNNCGSNGRRAGLAHLTLANEILHAEPIRFDEFSCAERLISCDEMYCNRIKIVRKSLRKHDFCMAQFAGPSRSILQKTEKDLDSYLSETKHKIPEGPQLFDSPEETAAVEA